MKITYNDIRAMVRGQDLDKVKTRAREAVTEINSRPFSTADSPAFWYASAQFWHATCLTALARRDLKMAWQAARSRQYAIRQVNLNLS